MKLPCQSITIEKGYVLVWESDSFHCILAIIQFVPSFKHDPEATLKISFEKCSLGFICNIIITMRKQLNNYYESLVKYDIY